MGPGSHSYSWISLEHVQALLPDKNWSKKSAKYCSKVSLYLHLSYFSNFQHHSLTFNTLAYAVQSNNFNLGFGLARALTVKRLQ